MSAPTDKKFEYRQNKLNFYPTHYALKYGISISEKTMKELMSEIYKYEKKNLTKLVRQLDPETKEYGYYIIADL